MRIGSDSRPLFSRLIAFDVFDGPIAGVAFSDATSEAARFRLMAWDDSATRRIFALYPLSFELATETIDLISSIVEPRWPEWWLQRTDDASNRARVADAVSALERASPSATALLLATHFPDRWELHCSLRSEDQRLEFQELSKRSSASQEVTDASFARWLQFVQSVAPPPQA
jgi:hypothetical protein